MSSRVRCAIYTRKSTDDGLDQEFNSLHAQREACEAFIMSQRSLGWVASSTKYDDGGLSGGTMERPALRRLLADIESRRVELVVVYKVDRLTRSLADFAKIVEVFDSHGISFVSVTQQFNTTTSMGRLTLNMLLSFAQFEREVTGERIRDKIAASKKKGMWMGGLPPLGYDVADKKLTVNHDEAETVRSLFRLYLELGTVRKLVDEAGRRLLVTKRRVRSDGKETGGQAFIRGHLYQLLSNPIYVGDVAYRGETYPGQHQGIIERETFDAVRLQLDGNRRERHSATNTRAPSLLTGLVYDETGERLCPTHAKKNGRRYRYYISKRLMHRTDEVDGGWRLPAKELDDIVMHAVGEFLKDEHRLVDALNLTGTEPDRLRTFLRRAAAAADDLGNAQSEQPRRFLRRLLHRVAVHTDSLRIEMKGTELHSLVCGNSASPSTTPETRIALTVPIALRRRGVEAKLVVPIGAGEYAGREERLITLVAQGHHWFDQLAKGKAASIKEIAERDGADVSDVGHNMQLAFLAPDIVEAILGGRQPVELTANRLRRVGTLPLDWVQQRRLLGFRSGTPT